MSVAIARSSIFFIVVAPTPMPRTPALIVPVVAVSAMFVFLLRSVICSRSLKQLSPSNGIIHHCFVCSLLLFLDRKHWIFPDFSSCISQCICILRRQKRLLVGRFLQLLVVRSLNQSVNTPLSQEIAFHFFRGSKLSVCRPAIHPINSILAFLATGAFLQFLELLYLPLFLAFPHHLVDTLALLERFLFCQPPLLLVLLENGMPTLFEILFIAHC